MNVSRGVAGVLQSHERNVFNEREIAVDVFHQTSQARDCETVKNHPHFDPDAITSSLVEARDCLVESANCLTDMIMLSCADGGERHTTAEIEACDITNP